ncbi:hydrophobic surface binding protein A-domain-containing protein [Aspergillus cavernicola]|uniref:Hydrophobic surface binding protein A-domain-containing protein n=1 Tax=Aspergillus cavernicola TaxID=176166 RepID=A0ABR4J346_9EURO
MHLNPPLLLPLLVLLLLSPPTTAGIDYATTLSNINTLHRNVVSARDTITRYNGNIIGAIPTTRALYSIHTGLRETRDHFSGLSSPLNADQVDELYDMMTNDIAPNVMDISDAMVRQAPTLNNNGMSFAAFSFIQALRQDTASLREALRGRVSDDNVTALNTAFAGVDTAFDAMNAAYS